MIFCCFQYTNNSLYIQYPHINITLTILYIYNSGLLSDAKMYKIILYTQYRTILYNGINKFIFLQIGLPVFW